MKYVVISDKKFEAAIGGKLVDQLDHKDFRAEIKELHSPISFRKIKKTLRSFNPDMLIVIGLYKANEKLLSHARSRGIKTCCYELDSSKKNNHNKANLILLTLPEELRVPSGGKHYIGNPLLDLIKDHQFEEKLSLDDHEVNVAVLLEEASVGRPLSKLISTIAKTLPKFKFHISWNKADHYLNKMANSPNIVFHANKSFDLLTQCNVAITTSGLTSLESALLNCPQVLVQDQDSKFGWFRKSKNSSIVNSIAGKQVVKELSIPTEILKEIDLILNDQQYCATMLDEYQEIKNRIGHERASRKAAQVIVDFLESGSS